ncbi:hypothetical protein TH468_00975 [Thalassospira sp. MCCC 1A03138]|nr:hypothetical protein TH468_00975 [Thalassospira sp. MCCC 1A03138]
MKITESFNVSGIVDTGERDSSNNERITINLICEVSGTQDSHEALKLTGRIIEQNGSVEYVEFDHPFLVPGKNYGIFSFVNGSQVALGTATSPTQMKASIADNTETFISVIGDLA